MEQEPIQPNRVVLHGKAPADRGGRGNHHAGFNDAIDNALDCAPQPPTGPYSVDYAVEVSPNPGKINEYLVTLTPR